MDNRLRLRHLRCFLETARLESLSAAAATLHISQPAASKTIRELEEILGVELFDRSGRRLRLTAAGRQYQQGVAAAMAGLARAQTQARRTPAVKTRLAIGVLPTASSEIFPRAALRFHDTVPDCILRVITGPNWMLLSQLREGAIDMMVGRMPAPDQMTGLAFEQLYVEDVVAVVRKMLADCLGRISKKTNEIYHASQHCVRHMADLRFAGLSAAVSVDILHSGWRSHFMEVSMTMSHSRMDCSGLRRFLLAVGSALLSLAVSMTRVPNSGRRRAEMQRLNGTTDSELAVRGLTRAGEVQRIFG